MAILEKRMASDVGIVAGPHQPGNKTQSLPKKPPRLNKALTLDCCRLRQVLPFVNRFRYGQEDVEALWVNQTLVHLTRMPEGDGAAPVHAYVSGGLKLDAKTAAVGQAAARALAEANAAALAG